ncbi:MAG: LysR family transcriptional regulator, partial [Lachnospiraceae bacterium]|nr:LysR family transcriptional regulator [Lachnospiraceae bacterium]
MDLRQIENIVAIEQEQSISKAAEKLFLTQSALNQQLLKLEKELGVRLFERRKHSMIPTFAGRIYLSTAHQMLDMKQ